MPEQQTEKKAYLTTEEVKAGFGWSRDSLYRFYRKGLIKPKKFLGDKKTYWQAAELEALKFKVFEGEESAAPSKITAPLEFAKDEKKANDLPLGQRTASLKNTEKSLESELESLQVWLDRCQHLTDSEKQAIWSVAAKKSNPIEELGIGPEEGQDFTDKLLVDWKRERQQINEELFPLFGRLQRAGRVFDKDVEASLSAHGLKVGEFVVLGALRRIGPPYCLTPTELFKSLLITSGTITKRIDRLETRGLVKRQPDPKDRRGTMVCLTLEGKELVDRAISSPGQEPYKWLQKVLTPLERKVLERVLRKLLIAREKETGFTTD